MNLVPPEWIVKPVDQAAVEGQDVVFQCRVAGIPLPTVTWRKLDKSKFLILPNKSKYGGGKGMALWNLLKMCVTNNHTGDKGKENSVSFINQYLTH